MSIDVYNHTPSCVVVHISVGVIVYSYLEGLTGTARERTNKDKVPRFVFYQWVCEVPPTQTKFNCL